MRNGIIGLGYSFLKFNLVLFLSYFIINQQKISIKICLKREFGDYGISI